MGEEQRKPWVLPVFFGLLIVLFWLITDLMSPPKAAEPAPVAVAEDDEGEAKAPSPAAGTAPEATSPAAAAP